MRSRARRAIASKLPMGDDIRKIHNRHSKKSNTEKMKGKFGEIIRRITPKKPREYMVKRQRDNYLPDTSDPYSGKTSGAYGGGKRKKRKTRRKSKRTKKTKRRSRRTRR